MKNKKGFTLIEIMIVVVIIGILASMALPRLGNQVKKASASEALSLLGSMARAAMQCYVMQDEDASKCNTLGLIGKNTGAQFAEETTTFKYATGGTTPLTFTATYKNKSGDDEKNIQLMLDMQSGAMVKCTNDEIFAQLRGVGPSAASDCEEKMKEITLAEIPDDDD